MTLRWDGMTIPGLCAPDLPSTLRTPRGRDAADLVLPLNLAIVSDTCHMSALALGEPERAPSESDEMPPPPPRTHLQARLAAFKQVLTYATLCNRVHQ